MFHQNHHCHKKIASTPAPAERKTVARALLVTFIVDDIKLEGVCFCLIRTRKSKGSYLVKLGRSFLVRVNACTISSHPHRKIP